MKTKVFAFFVLAILTTIGFAYFLGPVALVFWLCCGLFSILYFRCPHCRQPTLQGKWSWSPLPPDTCWKCGYKYSSQP